MSLPSDSAAAPSSGAPAPSPHPADRLPKGEVLQALTAEIESYRRRIDHTAYFALAALIAVVTGTQQVKIGNGFLRVAVFSALFAVIGGASVWTIGAFIRRVRQVRASRIAMCADFGSELFPRPGQSDAPSMAIRATILALAFAGILVTWVEFAGACPAQLRNGEGRPPRNWPGAGKEGAGP